MQAGDEIMGCEGQSVEAVQRSIDPEQGKEKSAAQAKRPIRLLLVEDDRNLLLLLVEFLGKRGFDVEKAVNGREALEKLSSFSFDIVFADLHLPLMNGQSILEWIKQNRPQTKVVIMTGDDTPTHIINAVRSGAVDYILKPFGLREFEEVVERCRTRIEPTQQAALITLIHQIMQDVRGDLVNLTMMAKLLERGHYGGLDSAVEGQIRSIDEKMRSMTCMVEDYCSIALMVGRGEPFAEERLDIKKDLIQPILDELSLEIKRKGLALVDAYDLASLEQTEILGNRVLLRGVFRTLLRNAVRDCSEEGTISYNIACNGRRFMIQIDNEGDAVPEDRRKRLFDDLDGSQQESCEFPPAGEFFIGLSLMRNIVRQHGGDMWYEALPHGSRFVFTLPAYS